MRILHLYYDIMNLYGDYANISALQRILEKSGEEVIVDRLSLGDTAVIGDYDFIFIGSGTEKNQKTVLADFVKYSDDIREYIKYGKALLMTGNSFEMLGQSVTDGYGNVHKGLGLYEYSAFEERGVRYTSDIICEANFTDKPFVGFINKSSTISGIEKHLFRTRFGLPDNEESKYEGIRDSNFFGTHLTGPILMKNPHFLIYLAELLLGREPFDEHLEYERKGYEITLEKLRERAQG